MKRRRRLERVKAMREAYANELKKLEVLDAKEEEKKEPVKKESKKSKNKED